MRKLIVGAVIALLAVVQFASPAHAASQSKDTYTPYGTLRSNVWRQSGDGTISGNTRQWDYQVSAEYLGTRTVQRIRTTWRAQASLRTGASMNLGVSGSGVSVGWSSNWQTATTPSKYWENTNGAKTSSWRSNIVEGPSIHYLSGSIVTVNTALLKISGDARVWEISAGV